MRCFPNFHSWPCNTHQKLFPNMKSIIYSSIILMHRESIYSYWIKIKHKEIAMLMIYLIHSHYPIFFCPCLKQLCGAILIIHTMFKICETTFVFYSMIWRREACGIQAGCALLDRSWDTCSWTLSTEGFLKDLDPRMKNIQEISIHPSFHRLVECKAYCWDGEGIDF